MEIVDKTSNDLKLTKRIILMISFSFKFLLLSMYLMYTMKLLKRFTKSATMNPVFIVTKHLSFLVYLLRRTILFFWDQKVPIFSKYVKPNV
jgi:hypothetical protein